MDDPFLQNSVIATVIGSALELAKARDRRGGLNIAAARHRVGWQGARFRPRPREEETEDTQARASTRSMIAAILVPQSAAS
jgi:hypothetical protein